MLTGSFMLTGSMVALITPMTADGKIDFASLERLVEFHIAQGTDAIVAVGTTGESATLSLAEQLEVVAHTVKFAAGRLPVIAGNGRNATADAIAVTQAMSKLGVAAMLGVTPYYNKPTQHGLIQHYLAVAASTDVPQILYNVPGRTGVDLLPATIAELSQVSNIIGVKEATGDLTRVATLRELCGQNFKLYSGDDATACDFLLQGGDGVISVANNVSAKQFKKMCDAALAGNKALAYELDKPMHGLYETLFCQSNPIPVKWAVAQMGLIETDCMRLPLTSLETNYHDVVRAAMEDAHIEVQ